MSDLAITYQHIANILSFETSNSELEKSISNPNFDWDAIVIQGSKHLVLPAIYYRLKSKHLLDILPDELNTYLEEIAAINRNRNSAIIKQVHLLTQLLNQHKIKHVFLKGAALLITDFYEDIGERMVGDIDILIATDQLDLAFNLLKNNDYFPIEQTIGNQLFEHKHLPRLKTKSHICAVELHRKLFVSYKDNDLTNDNILIKKQQIDNISIPSITHLLKHNVLNYQINDKGSLYNSISFRSAYDSIILLIAHSSIGTNWLNNKIYGCYFSISSLFFKDIELVTKAKANFSTSLYLFKLNHIKFYKIWNKLLSIYEYTSALFDRIHFFTLNKAYRKAVFRDRKRIYKHLISILNKS